jgi:hypothetical protein
MSFYELDTDVFDSWHENMIGMQSMLFDILPLDYIQQLVGYISIVLSVYLYFVDILDNYKELLV